MRKFANFTMMVMLLAVTQAAFALSPPPAKALAHRIADTVPSFWRVGEVVVTASVNTGDAVEPNIKQRFEATVIPTAALFVKDQGSMDAFKPYVPILPTVDAESERTLYGIAESTYSLGQWQTTIELENRVAGLGVPRDLFPGPTVVRGSEEEARILERMRPDVAQQVKRQLQAQLAKLKAEHDAQVQALNARQAEKIAALKADYAEQKRQYASKEKDLEARHEATVAALKASYAEQKRQYASMEKDLEASHQAEVAALKTKQESELARLRKKHDAKLKSVKLAFKQKIDALQAKIQSTGELIELQKKAKAKQAALAAARQATQNARVEGARALLAKFHKSVSADDADTRWAAFHAAMTSDNELLRQAALRVALNDKTKGSALRNRAMELALASEDPTLVGAVLPLALRSDDVALVNAALRIIFANADSFQMQSVKYRGDKYAEGLLSLRNIKVDLDSGIVTGVLSGSKQLAQCGKVAGSVALGKLALSGDNCQVAIMPGSDGKLVGRATDTWKKTWVVTE